MRLLNEAMEDCTFLTKTKKKDSYGGWNEVWTDGESFEAAIVLDTSMQARVAAAQGVTNLYTITTEKGLTLDFHEVFRRERDGIVFRVTSDGSDKHTPASATLNMRQVTAEEWKIPASAAI